ncbi:MAG: glycosyltransferase family 39 protein [Ruminococcus sp.]|jgi:hypothetical protein|nr:glycosyltransferase family 39 protein [Ruminococcus sp.]
MTYIQKTLDISAKYVQYFFAFLLCSSIFLGVLFRGFYREQWYIAVCVVIFVPILIVLYAKLYKKFGNISEKKSLYIFITLCVFVISFQIISAYLLTPESPKPSDLNIIDYSARLLAEDFDPEVLKGAALPSDVYKYTEFNQDIWKYFQVYPYQTSVLLLLTFLHKLGISPVVFNIFCLFVSYVLTYLTSKNVYSDNFKPLSIAIIAAIFPVFYAYTPVYYTDTMAMPFTIGCIYLITCGIKSAEYKNVIYFALAGITAVLGYFIKASVGIILPAVVIFLILTKIPVKKKIVFGSGFFGVFICLAIMLNLLIAGTGIYTKDSREEYEFPKTHWVMMGIKSYGGYFSEDFEMTYQAGNFAEKERVNIAEIKERFSEYNVLTFTRHVIVKVSRTWSDGAYFVNNGYLNSRFVNGKFFNIYSNIVNTCLLFAVIWGFFCGARRKDYGILFLCRVILCGLILFLIVWETRSRYLISFIPLILLMFPELLTLKRPNALLGGFAP